MIAPLWKLPSELRPIVAAFWTQPKFFNAIARATDSNASLLMEHEVLAHLSSRGRHTVACKSGHWIQLDEPELVVESIREMVESFRRHSGAAQ